VPLEWRFIQLSQSGHQLPGFSSAFSSQFSASQFRLSLTQWLRLLRAGLHAAVVFTASLALLLFLLWSVLQLFDENAVAKLD